MNLVPEIRRRVLRECQSSKMLETSIFSFSCSGGSIEFAGVLRPFDLSWEVDGRPFFISDSFGLAKAVVEDSFCSGASRSFVGVFTSKLECTSTNSVVLLLKLVRFSTEVGCHTLTLKLKRPKLRNTLLLQKSQTNVSSNRQSKNL